MEKIIRFRGKNSFLSNFYPCKVEFEGLVYPSVENAFQAAKTAPSEREPFTKVSPKEAKRIGREVRLQISAWESKKVKVMEELVRKKFKENPDLREKLLKTGDAVLIEGNTWGDEFWGVNLRKPDSSSPWGYRGKNILGQILMKIREELRKEG
ncbi:hypothetical protein C7457_0225 [Thermovibrio guaymasensis]|uniref:NADAR domain-containing protein n=1 Tax=Thermovibrio guaymasensis TaxID=240167 RepID=A0A420W7V1_9BACT|nr:NADAR family protein [Thermovibrio guaymasensis]RKQ63355.1 hypothetical protein C7457_0225 [Thermovibrio guaymasensis]